MMATARAEGIDIPKHQKKKTNYEDIKDYIDTATMGNAIKVFDAFNGFIFKDSLEIGMDPKLWAVIGIIFLPEAKKPGFHLSLSAYDNDFFENMKELQRSSMSSTTAST